MASVEKRTRDGAVTWLARWRDPDGKQRKRTFKKQSDARRFLVGIEADLQRGAYIDPADRTTVLAYAREWAATRPHKPGTARRVKSTIDNHLAPSRLADRRLADVRPSEVQAWVSDRAQVLAPSTLRVLVSVIRSVFHAAVLDRRIAVSPFVRISLPRHESARVVPLTVVQVQALSEQMPKPLRAAVIAQAGLGLRVGELLALRIEDVDFLGRTVRVEDQVTQARERTDPKTPRSRRTVPLPAVVADALSAHLQQYAPGQDGAIFTNGNGRYYLHEQVSRSFASAVRKAKLPEGTTSHALRHHYASVLLAAGESVVAVAERLGHEDASLVLTTYGHLMADTEDRTRRAVDDAWRAPTVPRDTASGL